MVVGTTVKRGDLHIKYRSPQQEHQFGYPYQLGHQETADHPQDAMLTHISVRPWLLHLEGPKFPNFSPYIGQRCCIRTPLL